MDLLGDAFGDFFLKKDAYRQDGEEIGDYETRFRALVRRMEKALQAVGAESRMPPEVYGWFLVNLYMRLEPSDAANVRGKAESYKLEDVLRALKDYVKWVSDHVDRNTRKLASSGMRQVVAYLQRKMKQEHHQVVGTNRVVRRSQPAGDQSEGKGVKRRISLKSERDSEGARDRQKPEQPGHRRGDVEPGGRSGSGAAGSEGGDGQHQQPHGPHGEIPRGDCPRDDEGHREPRSAESSAPGAGEREREDVRERSRSPPKSPRDRASSMFFSEASDAAFDSQFAGFGDQLNVLEMVFNISARDVHCSKGVWVVNQKSRKGAEVCFRKLDEREKEEFRQAMTLETNSFMSTEAVRICERAGIPKERIMNMRFVLTWKAVLDDKGEQVGQKPKARLIVRGFEDPGLLDVDRESYLVFHRQELDSGPMRPPEIPTFGW